MLGVDCERAMSNEVAAATHHLLITAEEKRLLAQCELPFNLALTAAFSLKESLYKALYPQLKQFMDFSAAARIPTSGPDLTQVTLRLTHSFSAEFMAGREFTGAVRIAPDEVLAWIVEAP